MTKNPIPHSDLWHTLTMAELQDHIETMSGPDRAAAYHIMMLTMNLCHATVQKAMESN
jgi:hypothetical protein